MIIYENGKNWVIEDQLDPDMMNEISIFLEKKCNKFLADKNGYSTKGKNSQQHWIVHQSKNFQIDDNKFYEFEKKYRNQILSRIEKSNLFNEEIKEKVSLEYKNIWTVTGEEHSYHTVHFHSSVQGISTVLYTKVPDTNIKKDPENNIFLIMNCDLNSNFYYSLPNHISINPEVGKLLIFPDWILHGTYPQTRGVRQTFNVNYGIKREKSKSLKYF